MKRILKIGLPVLIIAAGAVVFWAGREFTAKPDMPARKIRYEVPVGASASSIAEDLHARGILKKTWPFLYGYRLLYSRKSLKAGEYQLQLPASPQEILRILIEGRVHMRNFTVPEGLTLRETAELLEREYGFSAQEFLRSSRRVELLTDIDNEAEDLEGYLFPETYFYPKGTSLDALIENMIDHFLKAFIPEWKARAKELGMSIRDIVTLASLIEKETSRDEERELVSAVFHNRLRIGMKLDCDPTVVYAHKQAGTYRGRLWIKDLSIDSPYNTYRYPGLPPGPIASPGRASLEAALYPADADYLYFVATKNGGHYFSRTFREHQNAVNKYRRR